MIGVDVPRGIYTHIAGIDLVRDSGHRRVPGARGQRPHAERRLLRAREPPGHDPHVSARLSAPGGAAGPSLSGRAVPDPAGDLAAVGRSGGGDADARRAQQRLFRAQLPRPADGHRAGREPRPDRRRRRRLHEDDSRPDARRRDLPPRRRRVPRSACVPARLAARRARPDGARIAPATSRSPMRSATASPTTRRSTPTCPRSSSYYLGEEPILRNVDTYLCSRPADLAYVLGSPRPAGGQGGRRVRRLRHADGAVGDQERDRRIPRPRRAPIRATTSPSRWCRCRASRPSIRRTAGSSAGTSICGPTASSTATR